MDRFGKGFKIKVSARIFARNFALGFSGPMLLINPMPAPRALQRGETIRHAWRSVGTHLNNGLEQAINERRPAKR